MTKDEILTLKPGPELSQGIAEKVMGNITTDDATWGCMERLVDPADGSSVWIPLSPYSEDITSAETVVETMLKLGYVDAIYWTQFGDGKYSDAEAICKAALLAIDEAPVVCEIH